MTHSSSPPTSNSDAALVFAVTPDQRLEMARRQFFDAGDRPSGMVSEDVFQSWSRCLRSGRKPDESLTFDAVRRSRTSELLARNYGLLEAASEEMKRLESMLAGTSAKAVLCDRKGTVLNSIKATRHEGALLHAGCRVGVNLCELSVGTSALGISLATGKTMSVKGAEHFFDQVRSLNCVAAPVRDSSGNLAGVLNISIENKPFTFNASQIVSHAATLIENRLFVRQARDLVVMQFQAFPSFLGTPLAGLAGIDLNGKIAWINAAASAQIGWEQEHARGLDVAEVLGLPLREWLARCSEDQPRSFKSPTGVELWAQATLPHSSTGQGPSRITSTSDFARNASLQPLAQSSLSHIQHALAENDGNVARTARALGVSRGLIYRHLKSAGETSSQISTKFSA